MTKFQTGDLIMDNDPDWPGCNDLALVLHAAHAKNGQSYYTLYWCTGDVVGQVAHERDEAVQDFALVSKGDQN